MMNGLHRSAESGERKLLELGPFRGSPRPTMTTLEEKETLTKSNVIIIA
jgi:hypothetical protein